MFTRQCANKSSYVNTTYSFNFTHIFLSFFTVSPFALCCIAWFSLARSLSLGLDRSIDRLVSLALSRSLSLVHQTACKWRLFVIHLLILNHLTLIFVLHTLKTNYLNNRFLSLFRTRHLFSFSSFSSVPLIHLYVQIYICISYIDTHTVLHVSRLNSFFFLHLSYNL